MNNQQLESTVTIIQHDIANLLDTWALNGNWTYPESDVDCLMFTANEVTEAMDALLRINPRYVRNHPELCTIDDVHKEVADTLFMCFVWFIMHGIDAGAILSGKLQRMDGERR